MQGTQGYVLRRRSLCVTNKSRPIIYVQVAPVVPASAVASRAMSFCTKSVYQTTIDKDT